MVSSKKLAPHEKMFTTSFDNRFYGFILSAIFLGTYLVAGVFDSLYNESTSVVDSDLFILNAVSLVLVVIILFMSTYGNKFDLIKLLFGITLIGIGIAVCTELKNLLTGASGQAKEDTTQFVLALIAVVITLLCAFSLTFSLLVDLGYL